jgi:hypothetical protein
MITNLFYKPGRRESMQPVGSLAVSPAGIAGAVDAPPIRQLLILPKSTLVEFSLQAGDLRENVVLDDSHGVPLHTLPSGTVIELGPILVRLTVHCEPCPRVSHLVKPISKLSHKRGYLGQILSAGNLTIGDAYVPGAVQFEPIPYELKERAAWYLAKTRGPIPVKEFVRALGLSLSYCRAVPNLVRDISGSSNRIIYGSKGPLLWTDDLG